MTDSGQPSPDEGIAVDLEMNEEVVADVSTGEEEAGSTEIEPETPKLVLFAE